jgi:hypothetical protein
MTSRFARLVTRLVPERGSPYTRHLDPTVAELPAVGIEAARRAVISTAEAEIVDRGRGHRPDVCQGSCRVTGADLGGPCPRPGTSSGTYAPLPR